MKERPIIFSGPMVRAILDGRKTQTRRVVKPQPDEVKDPNAKVALITCLRFYQAGKEHSCPYGAPGDRLWVRETFAMESPTCPVYLADQTDKTTVERWKPSIHMPRWASRLTLEIVSVRVERSQDISEKDAAAEGCEPKPEKDHDIFKFTKGYETLWKSINGFGSWALNPWVWVIEFKKL